VGVAVSEPLLDYDVVVALQDQVASEMTIRSQTREAAGEPELDKDSERQETLSLIAAAVRDYMHDAITNGRALPDVSYDQRLIDAVYAQIYGSGQLQELLADPLVENIDINAHDEVWVTYADERGKQRYRSLAASNEDLDRLVQHRAANAGFNARPFTLASPELDLRLEDGARLSALQGASEHTSVSIRRNRFPQMFLAEIPEAARPDRGNDPHTLLELGTVDQQAAMFLAAAVRARHNIMVAGATDAGKTTLLRALIHCIPPSERLITVERALELGLRRHPALHPDVVEWEERLPDADGQGGISIDALVRRTRRHNPSRVIVGEVLGPEVVQMLSAMSQGNNGSLSTIHARDAADVFHRLATYAAQFERLPFDVTHALVASSIDFVAFIRKNPQMNGLRCLAEVIEVTGLADGRVARSRIFVPSPMDGRAERAGDVAIMRAKELADAGYDDNTGYPIYAGQGWYSAGGVS